MILHLHAPQPKHIDPAAIEAFLAITGPLERDFLFVVNFDRAVGLKPIVRRLRRRGHVIPRKAKVRMRTALGDAVRNLRRAVGMTQKRFGAAVGVGQITVNRWEKGRDPSGVNLARLEVFAMRHQQPEAAAIFRAAALQNATKMLPEAEKDAEL